ncbi:MAG: M14 family zinc carboxypeptidase, partial [Bacteroidales bacterium]|nr:M14 family zinc carboxypeptidase [Bacteroidales bacterium]
LNKKGEVYFRFTINHTLELQKLSRIISIDNVKGDTVWAYANKKEFELFLENSIPYTVLSHPGDVPAKMFDGKGIWEFDTYPTYSQYETMMQTFANNYPNICKLDTIGILPSGRKLLAIKISDNVHQDEAEPEFLFSGTIHGDETTGYVLLLRLINYLATNYGTNSEVNNIVNNVELFICPLANPDGTYAGGNNTVSGATRYNANNIDLNRNYPDPRAGQHPDGNAWQPETVAFMNYANNHNFVMAANTHGGAEVVNYPWDTWTSTQNPHADNNWWSFVSHEFADTAQANGPTGFFNDLNDGTTPGGDWYIITGGRQDYMNFYKQCREVTLEISTTKLLAANQLPLYWNYLHRSFINYIKQVMYGIKGIVTDACTNQPIRAKIWIENHDQANDSSHVYSALPHGNYHRPIYSGTYSMTVSASGYQSQTISNITVNNYQSVVRNVSLTPLPPVADFTANSTTSCTGVIQFINQSQYPTGSTFLWNFGDGQTSTDPNPTHTYTQSGTFTVTLTVINSCTGNNTKTKPSYITINLPPNPTVNDIHTCNSGNITLTANASGTVYWFDSPQSTTQLATGNTYQTTINQTTTFYLENHVASPSYYGGDLRSNSGGGFLSSSTKHYLIFNCNQPCKIVSVEVNAQTAGNRTIELQNSSGQVLQSATINIPAGISRITLNFNVPVGNGYRLVGPANAALYRNNTGSSYPYNIGNLINITGNSAGDPNYYYYFYNWEVKGPDCISSRVPLTVYLYTPPIANAGTDQNIINNTSATLTGQVSGGSGNYSIQWQPASLLQDPNSLVTQTVPLNNTQLFILHVTDNVTGCSNSDTVIITVNNQTNLNVTIQSNVNNVCPGTAVQLTANATGGSGNYTYNWSSNPVGFTSNQPNPLVTPTETTTYYVTVSDGNSTTSSSITINVLMHPLANFTYIIDTTTVYFTNLSTNANSYLWYFGDGTQSTDENPIHTYSANGDFNVTLIATNLCGSDTLVYLVTIDYNYTAEIKKESVLIYPNPFSTQLKLSSEDEMFEVRIYNPLGSLILLQKVNAKQCTIRTEKLTKGTYTIELISKHTLIRKIIIKE